MKSKYLWEWKRVLGWLVENFKAQGQRQGQFPKQRPRAKAKDMDLEPWPRPRTWSSGPKDPRGQIHVLEDMSALMRVAPEPMKGFQPNHFCNQAD